MFCARLLATLTQHPREIIVPEKDFEWNPECWTHNAFRAFELVFGRRYGIRLESSAMVDTITGRVVIRMHTPEMVIAHLEQTIRKAWKRTLEWQPFQIYVPVFAGNIAGMPPSPYLFAIGFSLSAMDNTGGLRTSAAVTYTVSTSNGAIVSYPYNNGVTYTVTSVSTSDGNSTSINHQALTGGGFADMWYFLGPTTASNTVTENVSVNGGLTLISASYSGVKQSAQPDSSNVAAQTGINSFTVSTTVVAANCWLMLSAVSNLQAPDAGTGTTARQRDNTSQGSGFYDSNATVGTGSQSLNVTDAGTGNFAGVIASFAPAAGAVVVAPISLLALLGVG